MQQPKVGVVVAAYGEDMALLAGCLRAIETNSLAPTRVVVVDDGMNDQIGWQWLAAHYMGNENWTFAKNSHRQGKPRSQLHAIDLMGDTVDYVMFVDSDTWIGSQSLAHLRSALTAANVVGSTGWLAPLNYRLTRREQAFYESLAGVSGMQASYGGVTRLPGAFAMFRRSVFDDPQIVDRYAALDKDLGREDDWLTLTLLSMGYETTYVWHEHAYGKTMAPVTAKAMRQQARRWTQGGVVTQDLVDEARRAVIEREPTVGEDDLFSVLIGRKPNGDALFDTTIKTKTSKETWLRNGQRSKPIARPEPTGEHAITALRTMTGFDGRL